MAHWEFLLQKEGDRAWLPLDTPDVEILEGRYRIVARSHHTSTAAEIRIAHLSTLEQPPRRRVQKRAGRTNADGLIVILPYTQFNAGLWEVQCASVDPMSDLTGNSWKYGVQLHVLLRESEGEDWELDWTPAEVRSLITSTPTASAVPPVVVAAAVTPLDTPTNEAPDSSALDSSAIDAFLEDLSQPNTLVTPELGDIAIGASPPPEQDPSQSPAGLSAPLSWSVHLDRDAFMASRDEVITISGYLVAIASDPVSSDPVSSEIATSSFTARRTADPVTSEAGDLAAIAPSAIDLRRIPPQALQICLRDPQNLQILVSESHSFTAIAQPIPFSFTVSLPNETNTRLILGEVLLCGSHPHAPEDELVLTSQSFTVTVDPGELLNELTKINQALAADPTEQPGNLPEAIATQLAQAESTANIHLSFLNKSAPVPGTPTAVTSLAGQPLPPQLFHPEPTPVRAKPLELPNFFSSDRSSEPLPTAPTSAEPPDVAVPPSTPSSSEDPSSVLASVPLTSDDATDDAATEPPLTDDPAALNIAKAPVAEGALATNPEITNPEITDPETIEPDANSALPSPIRSAFQSLRLQERFIARLSALATDAELAAALKSQPRAGASGTFHPAITDDSEVLAQEIVVDDDPVPTGSDRRRPSVASAPSPPQIEAEEAIPTPEVHILSSELVAGQPVEIQIKLPDLLQPMQVKLWINDVQTRLMLEGPAMITGFQPNGHGQMEAATHMTVPFGSTEIRFSAIAVELHSQRESRKTTCDRRVVPPNRPAITTDPF
jgi:hypothetical protein